MREDTHLGVGNNLDQALVEETEYVVRVEVADVLVLNSFQDTFGQSAPGSRLDLRPVFYSASGGQVLEFLCEQKRRSTEVSVLSDGEWEGPCWLILMHDEKKQ